MTNTDLLASFHRVIQRESSQQTLFEATVTEMQARRLSGYLVGGAVRDLVRGQWSDSLDSEAAPGIGIDIDIACDGDAIALAQAVADRVGATIHPHAGFGTATLELGEARIDLARTRRERYAHPAALPEVEPAGIGEDLARRDFTVNAMALSLTVEGDGKAEAQVGALIDHFGGVRDLERGLIRSLHDISFQDDPTRLIRACRYAARIEGKLAPATARAAHRDLKFLGRLANGRFGDAWRLLVGDSAAAGALSRARRLRLSQTWLLGWRVTPLLAAHHDPTGARKWGIEPSEFYWALTGLSLRNDASLDEIPERCALTKAERRALEGGRALRAAKPRLGRRSMALSAVVELLARQPRPATAAASVLWRGVAGHRSEAFVGTWRYVGPPLTAQRLIELGVARGPDIGRWLNVLRDSVLDGRLPPDGSAEAERWIQSLHGAFPPKRGIKGLAPPTGSQTKPEKENEP